MLIAAPFHDLGIWTDSTFDYLAPSSRMARRYLEEHGLSALAPEVDLLISEHHKLTRYEGPFAETVELYRRADWTDVSLGVIRFGLRGDFVREVRATFPDTGFHARLLRLSVTQLLRSPLRPLPMMRW